MYRMRVLPQQAEVLSYGGQFAAVRGGIRSGKSLMFASWMHDRMESYPDAQHYVVGADLPQLKRGFLRTFMQMLNRLGVEYDYKSSEGIVVLRHNGAKLESLSAEIEDRIRSAEFDSVLLEEPQTWRNGESVYRVVVGRMSGSMVGKKYLARGMKPMLRMSFNPSEVGSWLWDLLEERRAMPCWQFSVRKNFLLEDYEAYIAMQESQLPENMWSVELDGNWATFGGSVYKYYLHEWHAEPKNGLPPLAFDPQKPLLWALDFNVGHNCSVVMQAHVQKRILAGYEQVKPVPGMTQRVEPIMKNEIDGYRRRIFYVLDELRLIDAGSPDVIDEFLRRWGDDARRVGVFLYGDATGGGRGQTMSSMSAARSNWAIVVDGLNRAGIKWTWNVQSQNPAPQDRVNAVNTQLHNPDGVGMIIDHAKCPYLIRDFQGVKWVEGKNDLDKSGDKSLTHLSDALGYGIWYEQMVEQGVDVPLLQRDFMQR